MSDRRKVDRRVSPAIGEFALQERGELLARIEELEADRDRIKTIADNYSALNMDAQAELAALKAGQGEAVAHVSEESFSSDGTSDIITRNLPIGTALYTAPPATTDAVSVPRELLGRAAYYLELGDFDGPTSRELRALIAQSQDVKS